MALAHRTQEGGSWLVRLSLAQTGRWLNGIGRIAGGAATREDQTRASIADLLEDIPSPFGRVSAVGPSRWLDQTPPRLDLPPVPLGTHPPEWPKHG